MSLDVYTLYICEFYVLSFVSIIMVFAWIGSQYDRVLGFTCLGMARIQIISATLGHVDGGTVSYR